MTICERVFFTLDKEGKMAADLCRVLGVGTAQTTSWKRRNTDPPAKYIPAICNFLGVSLEYILTGVDNSKGHLSTTETEMLSLFRELPNEKKYEFIGELKGFLKATEYSSNEEDAEKGTAV